MASGAQQKVVEIQQDIKTKAEDYRAFLDELNGWETDIKKKDMSVSKKNKIEADYPPIRGTVDEKAVLKMAEEKEKEDPVMRQKDLGNEFFKKGKYAEAASCYARGISFDPDDKNVYLLHGNRAMSLLKLEKFKEAEEEATKCVQRNRTYAKGFFRRAIARRSQGKVKEAMDDLSTVLVLEPGSKDARTQLAQLEAEAKRSEKEVVRTTAPPRKKLQIVEVDDDEDEEEDEVEVPIKKKPAAGAPPPVKKESIPEPAMSVPVQEQESGVVMLDDDEVPKPKKAQPKPQPKPTPADQPVPRHVDPAATDTQSPPPSDAPKATPQASPKGKKVIVPRQVALDAAQEYKQSGKREIPRTFLEFERAWMPIRSNKAELAEYLRMVPRTSYQEFFRSNITEDILGDVIDVMHDVLVPSGSEDDAKRCFDILRQLADLTRLSALLIFAEDSVSEKLSKLPDLLKGKIDDAKVTSMRNALMKQLDG